MCELKNQRIAEGLTPNLDLSNHTTFSQFQCQVLVPLTLKVVDLPESYSKLQVYALFSIFFIGFFV
jgi:hypothetical protein